MFDQGLYIGAVISTLILGGLLILFKKLAAGSNLGEKDALLAEISELERGIAQTIESSKNFISKGQLETATRQLEEARANLSSEKEALTGIESKLDTAQKAVEEREVTQQDMKSSKAEDESKLAELLARFDDVSNESIELEQKLASSLKNLDSIMAEVKLSADQKSVLSELSNALTNAGSRLRDLLTEYQVVNDRLKALEAQHRDLEEEYTKLVEKQLEG